MNSQASGKTKADPQTIALRFVLVLGVVSFFADFTYEGSRSIIGPFLSSLGATGLIVALVTGTGELLGYGLRIVSGRAADRTGQYWPMTIAGYVIQMAAVPALALAHSWGIAAALIILERIGKAVRNPPRDTMLSHAAKHMGGFGWAFGLHEALDQFGALVGPLLVAAVLAHQGNMQLAFAVLALPAIVNLTLVGVARLLYPRPQDLDPDKTSPQGENFSPAFWIYLCGAGLVAAGFADYPLIAFHLTKTGAVSTQWIAVFYSVAMAVSGTGAVVIGRLFDRHGLRVLIALTILSAGFAPLVFLGGFWPALLGAALWGLGMGVHEAVIPAAVAPMVSSTRRASAYGLFTAAYGFAWFAGSAVIGLLYDRWITGVIVFCVATQFAAIPFFVAAARKSTQAALPSHHQEVGPHG